MQPSARKPFPSQPIHQNRRPRLWFPDIQIPILSLVTNESNNGDVTEIQAHGHSVWRSCPKPHLQSSHPTPPPQNTPHAARPHATAAGLLRSTNCWKEKEQEEQGLEQPHFEGPVCVFAAAGRRYQEGSGEDEEQKRSVSVSNEWRRYQRRRFRSCSAFSEAGLVGVSASIHQEGVASCSRHYSRVNHRKHRK